MNKDPNDLGGVSPTADDAEPCSVPADSAPHVGTCGDCRYYHPDEHAGGRGECSMRAENDPWERYRFGQGKKCSVLNDRFFPEFKPNAENMDRLLRSVEAENKRLRAELDSIARCEMLVSCEVCKANAKKALAR